MMGSADAGTSTANILQEKFGIGTGIGTDAGKENTSARAGFLTYYYYYVLKATTTTTTTS